MRGEGDCGAISDQSVTGKPSKSSRRSEGRGLATDDWVYSNPELAE